MGKIALIGRHGALASLAALAASLISLGTPGSAGAYLSTRNISPFPQSKLIVRANWTSPRFGPPANQWGDILPTVWADDGSQYTLMDDGGTDVPLSGGLWRQSLARITGKPPHIRFTHIGDPASPPPHTLMQIQGNKGLWRGPLGPYYSSGLLSANHLFYATQQLDWNWAANGPFVGLQGVAYSADQGRQWTFPGKPFPAPLGNLTWVIRGRGGYFKDGYAYAIASEREFNAGRLIMGRSLADTADLTDPAKWQWLSGWQQSGGQATPVFGTALASAVPLVSWASRITYPQMSYDAPLRRYVLTFTYSYASGPPAIWRSGAELLIFEAQQPWGPFSFVAHESDFGPSNGYAAGFPVAWISPNGRDLWLKWTANFDGCSARLDCSGGYGFNYRRMHLTLAGDHRQPDETAAKGRSAPPSGKIVMRWPVRPKAQARAIR